MTYLNYELSLLIDKLLKEKGIERGKSAGDDDFHLFSANELNVISKLTLKNANSLNDLDKLPNLQELVIESESFAKMSLDISFEESQFVNHIKDFSMIEKLSNLKSLTIINDVNITKLDVTNLKKLGKLNLINNPNLIELRGLDTLPNLENVIIYGSSINTKINLKDYINNTFETRKNILDINMYAKMVAGDPSLPQYLNDMSTMGHTSIKFAEQIGFVDCAILNTYDVKEMYNKCIKIFEAHKVKSLDEYNQIKFVYNYVVCNNKFDTEGLIQRERLYNKYVSKDGGIPNFLKKRFAMIHSSYSACMLNRSNCEGYVNLMKFMLSILGIRSYDIHCTSVDADNKYVYNHASIRVLYNDNWYYCEPTWEKIGELKYFMQPKSEFMETHVLNALEQQVKEVSLNDDNIRKISK